MAISKVAILGSGQMGLGMAQVMIQNGLDCVLYKATGGETQSKVDKMDKTLSRLVDKGKIDAAEKDATMARLTVTTDLKDCADVDLVIESVLEEVDIKADLFGQLDKIVKPEGIFSTNTSTLCVTELAKSVERKERFIGLHFFNPAPVMKLVEVIPIIQSDAAVISEVVEFCAGLGKKPEVIRDETGFVVNRLLTPYLVDAIREFERGLAPIQSIDAAMKGGCAHPMGPLELADYIGLDIVEHMATNLFEEYKEPRLAPPSILRRLVMAGQLGRKTGSGFYDYSGEKPAPRNELGGHAG